MTPSRLWLILHYKCVNSRCEWRSLQVYLFNNLSRKV